MEKLTAEQFSGPYWESEEAQLYREMLEHPEDGRVAFEKIYNGQRKRAYQIAYGILRNRQDAQEVTQDIMRGIWRSAHEESGRFRGNSEFSTWFYRIASNLARNKYYWNKSRGSQRDVSLDELLSQKDEEGRNFTLGVIDDKSLSPAEEAELDELGKQALKELEKLPGHYRQALILEHVNKKSHKEISELLRIPIGTVKSRIARARAKLRKVANCKVF